MQDQPCPFGENKFSFFLGLLMIVGHPKVIWYYFVRKLSGGELHDINGDPNQLGGDFLFSKDGRLLLSHPSQGLKGNSMLKTIIFVS